MIEANWLLSWIEQVAGSPLQQGVLAALSTFVLEYPTTLGCGLLVADQKMAFLTAFWGLSIGIALGDLGLYGLGRVFGPRVTGWGLVSDDRMERAGHWFSRNLVSAVIVSRFLPGMRLPTYIGAGVLKAPVGKFLAVAAAASALWTLLLLSLAVELGEALLPLLGRWKWPVIVLLISFVVGTQWLLSRVSTRRPTPAETGVSRFEFWPPYLFYIPVFFYYLWLAVRYRSLTLPTAANPSVYAGGLIGESKSQILDLIPPSHSDWVAAFILSRADTQRPAELRADDIESQMQNAGLVYPLVVKPDLGQRGDGVRPVKNRSQLMKYLDEFPAKADLMVQELIDLRLEAGILFFRFPEEEGGIIFSVTLKSFPHVTGNGRDTLEELIDQDPRASQIREVYLRRLQRHIHTIPGAGVEVPLVFAGNHCQGAVFRDGTYLVTRSMTRRFEEIVAQIPEFYFGRFDVRFDSIAGLIRGEGFRIIALKGAGGEATHIWDASFQLRNAYRVLFRQFEVLFEIGHQNRKRGHRPLGMLPLIKRALHYRTSSKGYPLTH